MLDMDQKRNKPGSWRPPILKVQALFDIGIGDILDEIEKHRQHLISSLGDYQFRKRKEKVRQELLEMVRDRFMDEVVEKWTETGEFEKAVEAVTGGETDPYSVSDNLVLSWMGEH